MTNQEIAIRPLHTTDASALYEIASNTAVTHPMVLLPSMELADTEEWVNNKKAGSHRLVAEIRGKVIGSCSLTLNQRARMRHNAKLGLMVHRDYWGQGVGSAMMSALIDLADNWLNVIRLELDVLADNQAAIHLYEKFDFVLEGTKRMAIFGSNGRYYDNHVMARINDTHLPQRAPTIPTVPTPEPADPCDNIIIRPLHPDDGREMHDLWRHPLVARTTLQLPSLSFVYAEERAKGKYPHIHRLVAEGNGRILGAASLHQHTNPRERHVGGLGMMVHPNYWGQGIGSRLMSALMDLADNWLNLRRVELEVHTDNPPAIHLYEKFGFDIEGTQRLHSYGDGRWADAHFMANITE